MADLSQVSIALKCFLRDEKAFNAIRAIKRTMPEAHVIVADDGDFSASKNEAYLELLKPGDTLLALAFDSGFGAKSNAIIKVVKTPYILIGSDDFNFDPPSVREGIEKMVQVLDTTSVDIASGRLRGPYEFILDEKEGVVREIPVNTNTQPIPWFIDVDLTVNYSLIRSSILGFEEGKVHWDSDVHIGGGEHAGFFLDVKRAGYRVAYVPGVQISEQEGQDSERYKKFRARSADSARPCFDRRGVRKYILGNGRIDYEAAF